MGTVYAKASKVIVWLGESDDDIGRAMDMLCDMERNTDLSELDWYIDKSEPKLDWHNPAFEDKSLHPGLDKLFSKEWFCRIWVVQEVSLPQKIPVILCGKREISFKLLWDLKFHLGQPSGFENAVQEAMGLDYETCSEIKNFPAKWNRYASQFSKSDEELLESFLVSTSRRDCTEPRDRIFGLLGLLTPEFALAHFPDEDEPIAKIYQRAMKNKNISHLPSWCIDFSTNWKNDSGFLNISYFPSGDILSGQARLIEAGELDSILFQGAELGRINLSAHTRCDLKTKDVSYIPKSVEEEIELVEEFAEIIRPFFAAVYQNMREKLEERKACKQLQSGNIWKLIGYGEDKLSYHIKDTKRWSLRLETYLWLIDPRWRIISKPWSLVPSILTDIQLGLFEQGCSFLDMVRQRYIPMNAELRECGAQLVWLIHRLSKCSFFVASEASKSYYGKADGMVEGGGICLLSGINVSAILRPKQGLFQLVCFAFVPILSQPETELIYSSNSRLTVKNFSGGEIPLGEVENLEKREFRLI